MPVSAPAPPFLNSVVEAFKTRLRGIYEAPSATPPSTPKPWEPPPSTIKEAPPPLPTVQINPLPQQAFPPRAPYTNLFGQPAPRYIPEPPPSINPVPEFAPPPGSGGAAVVTTTAGGVVTGAGLLTGGLALVAGGLLIHDAHELYKLWKLSQPEPKAADPATPLGEKPGTPYSFNTSSAFFNQLGKFQNPPVEFVKVPNDPPLWSPITKFNPEAHQGRFGDWYITVTSAASQSDPTQVTREIFVGIELEKKPTITNLRRHDDQPNQQPAPPVAKPNRPPLAPSSVSPGSASPSAVSPSGVRSPTSPPSPVGMPLATNNRVPVTITTPGAAPITITSPGAAPITISPTGSPATIKITRPSNSPLVTGNPTTTPTPTSTPTGTPTTKPAGVPISVSSPGSPPINLISPGTGPVTISIPGQKPITFDPTTTSPPSGLQAPTIPKPGTYAPIPITPTTTPATPTQTPTNPDKTPTTPTKPTQNPENPFADIKDPDLAKIGLGLVGITQLLQGLNTNTTPAAIQNAVTPAIAPAVCTTTKPGGCSSNMVNNAVNQGNEDLKQFLTKQLPNLGGDAANAAIGADTNARVKNIENRTGSHRYPMTLPEYLLDDFIDKPIVIQDQVDFNVWLVKNVDALVGLFPIKIERTDENGVKQMLKFENIAEAIAELTGLLAEIAFDADTSVNVGVHATSEAIGAKVAAIQGNSYLKAISDYLGYQGSHKSIDVPISCTPGAVGTDDKLQENELGDFLKSSTQRAIGWECTERDDLHSIIKRILFDSEIARAALYKPLKPPKPGQTQPVTGDAIKADRRKEKDREDNEWDKFKTRIKNQEGTGIDIDIEEKSLTDETTP